MTLTTHRVPVAHLDALLWGGGTGETIAVLRAGQLSKHTLLVRAVADIAAGAAPAEYADARVDEVYQVICDAQRTDPAAVERLLLHPHVGAWAVHCLRLLHGGAPEDRAALRGDLAHLASIAASAAILARVPFAVEVPVRDGLVHLPTLGAARLPAGAGTATIRGDGGDVRTVSGPAAVVVPLAAADRDGPGWLGLRRLTATADDLEIAVDLEDLDVYRGSTYPSVSGRLDDATVEQWRELFVAAWRLLVRNHRPYAEALAVGLRSVVPQVSRQPGRSISATSTDAFGSVGMSLPSDPANLALTLVHEFQHAKLSALMDLIPLYRPRGDARYYAPWRDDPRPLGGLLQGVYAFVGVTDFWRVHRRHEAPARVALAEFEFARWREQTRRAVDELSTSTEFTDVGRRLVAALRSTLDGWRAEEVPAELAAQARDSALDHLARWRVRNIRPDVAAARAFADAWRAGAPCPRTKPARHLVDGGAPASVETTRFRLWHLRMTEPDRFARLRTGDLHDPDLADVTTADIAYVDGDYTAAARLYLERIRAEPDFAGAWIGLALARLRSGLTSIAACLLARPETLLAVHRNLRADGIFIDPETLAGWLDSPAGTAREDLR